MSPIVREVFARETGALETAAWVPPLFAFASVFIGMGHVIGDDIRQRTPISVDVEGGQPGETVLVDAPEPVRGMKRASGPVAHVLLACVCIRRGRPPGTCERTIS